MRVNDAVKAQFTRNRSQTFNLVTTAVKIPTGNSGIQNVPLINIVDEVPSD